jgi:uncharacterized protein (DUF342 family)
MEMIEKWNDKQDIKLLIEQDGSSAYLQINTNHRIIDASEITSLIENAGINFGFDLAKERNQELTQIGEMNETLLIARGQRPVDAQIEFTLLFNKESAFHPAEFDNNFKALENYERVRAETPLADLFVTKKGNAGIDIFGNTVGSDEEPNFLIQKYLGENVYYSEDRSQIIAHSAGYPYIDEDGKVNVKSQFEIDHTLDLKTDNFKLYGDLVVRGNIEQKIKLEIQGNLTVHGDINDADIRVSGTVNIHGDVLNCPATGIVSQGNIIFDSAENARIVSAGKIEFRNNVHFCRIIAEKGVYSENETGSIVGGLIQSGEHIEVSIIGNSSQIGTEVEITISPYTKEKMLILTKKIMMLREKPVENASQIETLEDELQTLENKLEKQINKALLSEDELPKHIAVYKKIFSGSYVRILKKSQSIMEDMEKVSFTISQGELVYELFEQ